MELTDNQIRALDYLKQYEKALENLEYMEQRTQMLRDKANSIRSPMAFEEGWTGKYREKVYKSKKKREKVLEKVMVPLEGTKTHDPHAKENLLCVLVNQSKETDNIRRETEEVRASIENFINATLNSKMAKVIKYRYLLFMSFKSISDSMPYSESHIYRLHDQALEEIGQKMRVNESKC